MVQTRYFCDLCGKESSFGKLNTIKISVANSNCRNYKYKEHELEVCDTCRDLCTPVIQYKDGVYRLRDYYRNGYADNQK
jgi:ribosome-binding protein aMBF1 (putative translation factor)